MVQARTRLSKSVIGRIGAFSRYVWEADTPTAYVLNIFFAFLIIKYLIYPGLGLLFGTAFPVVAVVSSSMEHHGDWLSQAAICGTIVCTQEDWYEQHNISAEDFKKFYFSRGFNKGDVMVLFGTPASRIKEGDVIVFAAGGPEPIIHRVVQKQHGHLGYTFATKGDNNPTQLPSETFISQEQIIGRAVFRIPFLGYIKIWFVELMNLFRF